MADRKRRRSAGGESQDRKEDKFRSLSRVVEIFFELDNKIDALQEELARCKEQKSGLLKMYPDLGPIHGVNKRFKRNPWSKQVGASGEITWSIQATASLSQSEEAAILADPGEAMDG